VDGGFVTSAPTSYAFDAAVDAARGRVFAAIVDEVETWPAWFPGVTGGSYASADERGEGATRLLGLAGARVRETVLIREEPHRWVYRVDAAPLPIAHAMVEAWRFDELPYGTHVRWTVAIEPTALFPLLVPFPRVTIGALWRRAMRNFGARLQIAP
jgi:polyketide cyclase/dehydrase/lipid transport protein